MKKSIVGALLVLIGYASLAQDSLINSSTKMDVDTAEEEEVQLFVEVMPEYVGGQDALSKFLSKNIIYPKTAAESGLQGTVYIAFVVEKNGRLSHIKVRKGVEDAPELGAEAVRVVKMMDNWIPGRYNGLPIRTQMTLPIKFTLNNPEPKKKKKRG